MRTAILLFVMVSCAIMPEVAWGQYKNVEVASRPKSMKIVQIDEYDNSTYIFIQYNNYNGDEMIKFNDNTYVTCAGSTKKYYLMNSINMPLCCEAENKYLLLDNFNQKHNFVLEFERIPDLTDFDIIENVNDQIGYNFTHIAVDQKEHSDFMDVEEFIKDFPVKEKCFYYEDGDVIQYIKYKGVQVTTNVKHLKKYGNYFNVYVDIQNFSRKSILFNPQKISANGLIEKKNKIFALDVLDANDYDLKVKSKQALNKFFVGLAENIAAMGAGESHSTIYITGNIQSNGSVKAYGNMNNIYGYAHATGSVYTSVNAKSTTTSYNGYAQYLAFQQANSNLEKYAKEQSEIRKTLNEGYVKKHTIQSGTKYVGYFNIQYKNVSKLSFDIIIDDIHFNFDTLMGSAFAK